MVDPMGNQLQMHSTEIGNLAITVLEASDLQFPDSVFGGRGEDGDVDYSRLGEDGGVGASFQTMDPRVVLMYDKMSQCTSSIEGQRNPVWGQEGTGEQFLFSVTDKNFSQMVIAKVFSRDVEIGGCTVSIQDQSGDKGRTVDKFFTLENESGEYRGMLRLCMEFTKQRARRNEATEVVKRLDVGNLQQTVTRSHVDYKDLVSSHTDFKDPNQQAVYDQKNLRTKLFDKLKTAFFDDLRLLKRRQLQRGGIGDQVGTFIPVGYSQLRIGILGGRDLQKMNKKYLFGSKKLGVGISSATTSDVFVKALFRPDCDMSQPDVVIGMTNTEYASRGRTPNSRGVDPIFGSRVTDGAVADANNEFHAGTDRNCFTSEWEAVKFYMYVGVTYEGEVWRARYDGKDLGGFETEEKAAMAYDAYVREQARKGVFNRNQAVKVNIPMNPGEISLQRNLDDDGSTYNREMYKSAFAIGRSRELSNYSKENVLNYFCKPVEDPFKDQANGAKPGMVQSGWSEDFADVIFEVYDEEKDDIFEGGRSNPQAMGECGIPVNILNDQSFKSFDGFSDGSGRKRMAWKPLPCAELGGRALHPKDGTRNSDRNSKNLGKVFTKAYNEETEYTFTGYWAQYGSVWQMDDAEAGVLQYGDEIVYRGQWQKGQLKMPLMLPVKQSVADPWPVKHANAAYPHIHVYVELIEQTPVSRKELEAMEDKHNQRIDGAIRKEMEIFKPLEQQDLQYRDQMTKSWKTRCMSLIPGMPNAIPYRRSMTEYDDGLHPWYYECDHVFHQIELVKQMMQKDISGFSSALSREVEESKEAMREVDQSFHDDYMNYCRSRTIANLEITVIEALDLELPEAKDPSSQRRYNFADSTKSEPYIKIFDSWGHELWRSKHRKSERNPKWNETFTLEVKTDGARMIPDRIRMQVFDHDGMFGDDNFLGEVWLEMAHLCRGVWVPSNEDLPERYGVPGMKGNAEPPKCAKERRIPGHPHYNEIRVAEFGKGQLKKRHFANEKEKARAVELERLRRVAMAAQATDDATALQAGEGLLGQGAGDMQGADAGYGVEGEIRGKGLASLAMAASTTYALDPYGDDDVLKYNPTEAVKVQRKGDGHVRPYKEMDKDGLWIMSPMYADKILCVGTTMDIIVNNVDAGKWERSHGKDAASPNDSSGPSFQAWQDGGKVIPDNLKQQFPGGDPWFDLDSGQPREEQLVYSMLASLSGMTTMPDKVMPHAERYEMKRGTTLNQFQLLIEDPEKPLIEIHEVIVKTYESGREEVILVLPPGKRWHWGNKWTERAYKILQVLPKNPYCIYDKLPTGRHQELEVMKCLREPEVCYSEEQGMELEGMYLFGVGQSGGFDSVEQGTHSEQEAYIDGWYNLKPIMPLPGQSFHTDDDDHNRSDNAEEAVPPMMRGYLRVKTAFLPVDVQQDDRESFERLRDEKEISETMQGGQDQYLQEEVRQMIYNPQIREQLRDKVPSELTRSAFWNLFRVKQVRNRMLTDLFQALMTKKCVKDDRKDLIDRVEALFVNDRITLERFPAEVFDADRIPITTAQRAEWENTIRGTTSKTVGSFTCTVKRGRGLLPETGDQIQRVFVSRYARVRVIGGAVSERDEQVQAYCREHGCSFQDFMQCTGDIGRAQKVSRQAIGSNPMGFNQSSMNTFDQSVIGVDQDETKLTQQNVSNPDTFGDTNPRRPTFHMFDEANLVRIEVMDKTKKLERVTLDEKKTFILPDTKHNKLGNEIKGVSSRLEDRYLEEEVCVGVVTVSYKELLTVFEDCGNEINGGHGGSDTFEQWFHVGPDTSQELMSTMQLRQRYLKQKPRGKICVQFDLHDKSLQSIRMELEQRASRARSVRCQIESRTLLDEMRLSMIQEQLTVSAFYTEFTDPVLGVITQDSLTRGMKARYSDRCYSEEAIEGVWNELDGSGQSDARTIVQLLAATHTTPECKQAAGRYVEDQGHMGHHGYTGGLLVNRKPVYRHQEGYYAIAFNGEHWVILPQTQLEGLARREGMISFLSPFDDSSSSGGDSRLLFVSNGTARDEDKLHTSAWAEFRIFKSHAIQDGVVTFVEFCTALGFDPHEDADFRDMFLPSNFLNTRKLEKWISTLSNRKIMECLVKLEADNKDDVEDRLKQARQEKEKRIRDKATTTKDSLIDMMKYHASFAKKIKNVFHWDYIRLLERGGTYDIGGLREFKLFTAKPATLLVQIEAAENFRLPMVDDIHSAYLYPDDLQLELIRQRNEALKHYYDLAAELADLQSGRAGHMSSADLAKQGNTGGAHAVSRDANADFAGKQSMRAVRVERRMHRWKAVWEKLDANSQFRTGALSKGFKEASPFALLYPYVRAEALAGAKNISVASVAKGKEDDPLLMAQKVKVVTEKGPMAAKMLDHSSLVPSSNPGDTRATMQPQTLFKVGFSNEVFKFDINDCHMGAVDLNLMSDVPDDHGLNGHPDDVDYFGGDATLEDGSARRMKEHKFGNSAVDERTQDSFIGSVRINAQDMYDMLYDRDHKDEMAGRMRGNVDYNRDRHTDHALLRRSMNLSGAEEEMVAWSKQRNSKGKNNKPEMKFEVIVTHKELNSSTSRGNMGNSMHAHKGYGGSLWVDVNDKKQPDYNPALCEHLMEAFKDVLNHPKSGRFSQLDRQSQSTGNDGAYGISKDYLVGSLRKGDKVHILDANVGSGVSQVHREGFIMGVDRNFKVNNLAQVEFGDGVVQSIDIMNLKNATDQRGVFQPGAQMLYQSKDELKERAKVFDCYQVRLRKRHPARVTVDKVEYGPKGIRLTCRGPPAVEYSPAFGIADYIDGLEKSSLGHKRSASHASDQGRDLSHLSINKATLMVLADKTYSIIDNARKVFMERKLGQGGTSGTKTSSFRDRNTKAARFETDNAMQLLQGMYEALEPTLACNGEGNIRGLDCYVQEMWFFPLLLHEKKALSMQMEVLERFDTTKTDAHMQYEKDHEGSRITLHQWLPFERSKNATTGMASGRVKVKMCLMMREQVEPYDTAEFVPHDDLVKILHKVSTAFGATEKRLKKMSIDRDMELMKVLKLQRDLGTRIRNEARLHVLTQKINFEMIKRDENAPRAVRDYKHPEERARVRKEWLPDVRTGHREPIIELVEEVKRLCQQPVYKKLLSSYNHDFDHTVEIPMPVVERDSKGALYTIGVVSPHCTLVQEEEQLMPSEFGMEDGDKVLSMELQRVRMKIRMALREQSEIRDTVNQEALLIPRLAWAWNQEYKGIHTSAHLRSMQKRLEEKDLPGLRDDDVSNETRRREFLKLRQAATMQEEHVYEEWKEVAVSQTNSIKRTLSTLGSQLSRRISFQRKGEIALPRYTPAAFD